MRAAGDLCGQLLVLVLLPVFAHAGYERTCFRGQEGPRAGVCGRQLSNMLDFLCDGNFNTLGKRNSGKCSTIEMFLELANFGKLYQFNARGTH